ncbi:uncharacterized protein L201_000774 [Kwoniella dendrophila CBS 6074]|uniref:Uncharacterized protein n=1 Tax=Kwoniella dendrophila CBS 6074 TaxID=1295534 RepID=A0AAX4JKI4_9TREE
MIGKPVLTKQSKTSLTPPDKLISNEEVSRNGFIPENLNRVIPANSERDLQENTEEGIKFISSTAENPLLKRRELITVKHDSGTKEVTQDSGTGTENEKSTLFSSNSDKSSSSRVRKLSLSSLINLPKPTPIKIKDLVKKLSNSSPPSSTLRTKKQPSKSPNNHPSSHPPLSSSPSSPNLLQSEPLIKSTMPVVPTIKSSSSITTVSPSTGYPTVKQYWNNDMSSSDEEDECVKVEMKRSPKKCNVSFSASTSSSTLVSLDEEVVYTPSHRNYPSAQKSSILCNPRRLPLGSRNSSFGDDLTSLREVDESLHVDKPCSGVWLCSRPAAASSSSFTSANKCFLTPMFTSKPVTKTITRPTVIRATSSGTLPSDCLSGHSDRILEGNVSSPSLSSTKKPARTPLLRCPMSNTTTTQSNIKSKSLPNSPIEKPSSGQLQSVNISESIQPKNMYKYGNSGIRHSSTENLINQKTTKPISSLNSSNSIGNWRKKALQVGKSILV